MSTITPGSLVPDNSIEGELQENWTDFTEDMWTHYGNTVFDNGYPPPPPAPDSRMWRPPDTVEPPANIREPGVDTEYREGVVIAFDSTGALVEKKVSAEDMYKLKEGKKRLKEIIK